MTIEEALQLSEVMKAYSEGKTVQVKSKQNDTWVDISWTLQTVDTGRYNYRIKPEEPKPRPYKDAKEFLNAQKEHGPYMTVNDKSFLQPQWVLSDGVMWVIGDANRLNGRTKMIKQTYAEILNSSHFKWQDGHPTGILEE